MRTTSSEDAASTANAPCFADSTALRGAINRLIDGSKEFEVRGGVKPVCYVETDPVKQDAVAKGGKLQSIICSNGGTKVRSIISAHAYEAFSGNTPVATWSLSAGWDVKDGISATGCKLSKQEVLAQLG